MCKIYSHSIYQFEECILHALMVVMIFISALFFRFDVTPTVVTDTRVFEAHLSSPRNIGA